ncbi:fumarylacetoacetate hydrolase family protein [Bordetella avium]|uniref:Hydrolase n=1 Tax=Bordetella avium (strain 197N) TaxID=360910 RepID=Q2KXH3_BORA1|nr:fumarylacetoacetate hydrolase family protein [Bordetella avium]AZY51587.1 FAA hydrolase family protein [Bordetella avium]RIQ13549.1 FAA hydrolase family protein [Bordetella avium]RIQ16497.1 FAA hydrolase family protein [Bordetella avium]RIQ31255.1 FAA hydrolase family protein [Bordetella avium]RIQ36896.1 FAA hydrolase family protein [Bordetella avium]
MKLQSFVHAGAPAWGIREGEQIRLMTSYWPDVASALAAGSQALAQAARQPAPLIDAAGLQWLAPVVAPGKILCVGLNYGRHVLEAGRELPKHPSVFARYADSLVGADQPVWRPQVSEKLDFEAELAVVIGRGGRHIPASQAMEHVAGYTCMAENSVRDFQKHNAQVTPGKNFERSGALGPWLVTADEVPDPTALRVRSYLNGDLMQDGSVADLIFSIPTLIAYISSFTPLAPGDVIATGTPEGVGATRQPPRFLRAGDVFEVDIPGVGRLANPVIDEPQNKQAV